MPQELLLRVSVLLLPLVGALLQQQQQPFDLWPRVVWGYGVGHAWVPLLWSDVRQRLCSERMGWP